MSTTPVNVGTRPMVVEGLSKDFGDKRVLADLHLTVEAQTRFEMEDMILRLRHELGLTVIQVTHDIDEAVYLSDRVIVVAGRPTRMIGEVTIDLGNQRDQVSTKADPAFAALRTRVMTEILTPDSARTAQVTS